MRAVFGACALLVGGCATSVDQIKPIYVSPVQFEAWDCDQIRRENNLVEARLKVLAGPQGAKAIGDAAGVALAPLAPTTLLMLGTGDNHANEIGELKGRRVALRGIAVSRPCRLDE